MNLLCGMRPPTTAPHDAYAGVDATASLRAIDLNEHHAIAPHLDAVLRHHHAIPPRQFATSLRPFAGLVSHRQTMAMAIARGPDISIL